MNMMAERAYQVKKRYSVKDFKDKFIFLPHNCMICEKRFSFADMKRVTHIGYGLEIIHIYFYICFKCWYEYMVDDAELANKYNNKPQEPMTFPIELEKIDTNFIAHFIKYKTFWSSSNVYCQFCEVLLPHSEKCYIFTGHFKGNTIYEREHKKTIFRKFVVCSSCAKNKQEAASIMLDIIKNKYYYNKPQGEKNMNVLEILNEEMKRLEKQLSDLETVKLPENMPQHIIEHLSMKKTLVNNCIKSIKELQDSYSLDETIKKLFST